MNTKIILAIRIIIAIILVQTLYFKFTAHTDSIFIFSKVGLEPYGRIGIGILELISAILILIPRTIWLGALLTVGLMSGAITMHLTQLGIEINNDGGALFYMALGVFLLSVFTLINQRKNIPIIGNKL
ncbi:MAG: DoxX family protein [Urechidicola sp.]|nr:DoxX family protein [Urechidicola sp.]